MLADATSHGAKFTATGSDDFTGDDVFKSMEVKVWRQRIKKMKVVKSKRMERLAEVKKGEAALEIVATKNINVLSRAMKKDLVDTLLVWYNVPDSNGCHFIADRRKKWMEIRGTPPPLHTLWTEEDKASLSKLKEFKIDMSETALGRLEAPKKRMLKIVATKNGNARDERIE